MSVLDLLSSKLIAMDAVLELPVGEARVVGFRIHEGLSRHTAATVELSTHEELDVEPLLQADAGVVIRKNGLEVRRWSLKVAGGGFTRIDNGAYRYELDLRSPFWFLEHTLDTRKFRELSSRDIIATVLQKDGIAHRFAIVRQPDVRKYCVQYRESDRDFVERLLEYEGIFHYTDAAGVLVLRDVSPMSPDIEGERRVELIESAGALQEAELGLQELAVGARTVSGKVSLNDFDWKRPSKKLLSTAAAGERPDLEVYEAPGGYRRGDQGTLLSRLRLEALQALELTIEGRGNVPAFAAGHFFEIDDRLGEDFAGDKLLVEVEHFYSDNRQGRPAMFGDGKDAAWGQDQAAETTIYGNRFVSIPRSTPYRPPMKTPVPNLAGCHTAMVRGPAGEEIHTDKYGRFRAQFHWDREAVSTDEDSRWLRILQESNSSLFLARIGWEMNVAYIHGDPDRPIGLARDINGVMTPAYSQPGDKNVMTIKTPSSPATGGFNELRLDDSAGSMTMFLQAERDMRNRVKNDMFETVGNNEKHVSGDQFGRTVERDQTVTIGADASYTMGDNHDTTVTKNRVVTIGGNEDVVADQGSGLATGGNDTENVGSVRLTIDGSVKPPKIFDPKDLVPDPKAAAKAAGQAALSSLKSGGGLGGAASAAGASLKGLVPTPQGIADKIKGSLSLDSLLSQICTGTINRSATKDVKRTVGGAYISLALGNIETSAGKLFFETIGGAKVTVAKGSIDQSAGKVMAITVGGVLMHTTSDKYGVSGKSGTVLVGGTASMTATEKIEIVAEEVTLTAGAKLTFAGPKGSIELTPASLAFTGDVLLEPGTKLKTTGTPLNLTKAGG